ncbi:hypothetical protein ACI65C_013377 [Semiaphis heraclei]
MFATSQLAEQWAQRWSGEMSPELFTESEVRLISPPQYSAMSPMHEDPSQAQRTSPPSFDCLDNAADGFDSDNFTQHLLWYNNRIQSPPTSLAVDETDGPTSFNNSPSNLGFTGGKPTKKTERKTNQGEDHGWFDDSSGRCTLFVNDNIPIEVIGPPENGFRWLQIAGLRLYSVYWPPASSVTLTSYADSWRDWRAASALRASKWCWRETSMRSHPCGAPRPLMHVANILQIWRLH